MYEFARGPLVWIAFAIFIAGIAYRLIQMVRLAKKEKVILPYLNFRYAVRSMSHWLFPYGSVNMRLRLLFTLVSFVFHICLIITPIFVLAHVVLFKESWGFGWWSLPDSLSNTMTILVVVAGIIFALRRVSSPAVRYVTLVSDYLLLLVVEAPFLTGLLAHYQVFNYEIIITIHIWSGALWLAIIPFTRISHMLFFPFTRSYMGSEFGYVRHAKDW